MEIELDMRQICFLNDNMIELTLRIAEISIAYWYMCRIKISRQRTIKFADCNIVACVNSGKIINFVATAISSFHV